METQCVPAVGECRLKKRRRTGGSDSTFDEARDITFEEEEDDSPDDGSDEPQDTLCTLCGVFLCEEDNSACDHCRAYSPDNSESPFNLSECAVVADLLEGKGGILYVENTLEDSLKAYDRNDAEVTVREEDTRDPQKLWGNNAAEYLSKIRKSCYVRASREFVWYEQQIDETDDEENGTVEDISIHEFRRRVVEKLLSLRQEELRRVIGAAPVLNASVLEECMAAEFATDQTEAARYLDKVRAYMGRRSLRAVATTLDNFVDYLKEHFPCPEMFGAVVDVGDVEDRCPENYFVEADRMLDLARGGGIVATAAPCAHGKTFALWKVISDLRSSEPDLRVVHIGCRVVQAIDMTTDEALFYQDQKTNGAQLLRKALLDLWNAEVAARIKNHTPSSDRVPTASMDALAETLRLVDRVAYDALFASAPAAGVRVDDIFNTIKLKAQFTPEEIDLWVVGVEPRQLRTRKSLEQVYKKEALRFTRVVVEKATRFKKPENNDHVMNGRDHVSAHQFEERFLKLKTDVSTTVNSVISATRGFAFDKTILVLDEVRSTCAMLNSDMTKGGSDGSQECAQTFESMIKHCKFVFMSDQDLLVDPMVREVLQVLQRSYTILKYPVNPGYQRTVRVTKDSEMWREALIRRLKNGCRVLVACSRDVSQLRAILEWVKPLNITLRYYTGKYYTRPKTPLRKSISFKT